MSANSAVSLTELSFWERVKERWTQLWENESSLGYLLLVPLLVVVLGLIGYPFLLSLYFSMSSKVLGRSEFIFVGLANYIDLLDDPIFRRTIWNTFNYSVTAVFFKMALGMVMALALNEVVKGRRFFRATFLLPWVAPSALSVLAWVWMFDSQFSIITWALNELGLYEGKIPWLGRPALAMAAVQTVNVWRGVPFFGMMFLAGIVTVSKDLYEAATVDGANAWQRFWSITFPHILPIIVVATLFSFVRTLGDFQIVWILTKGGPINSTHLVATLAYRSAIQGGNIGQGAAIASFLFPFLVVIIILQIRYLRREE
jgi:multiple sugar transport system permease protein